MASALLMTLTIFWASNYVTSLAETSPAYIPLQYIVPLASGAAAAFLLATNRKPRLPKSVSAVFHALMAATEKRLGTGTGTGGAA
jgi:lipopolysaccharide export system permease protein